MSRAIHIEGVAYLSAIEAGKIFGYSNDYIARLAREEKILGKRVGRQWFVDPDSVASFLQHTEEEKLRRAAELRAERKRERLLRADIKTTALATTPEEVTETKLFLKQRDDRGDRIRALLQSGCVVGAGTVLGAILFLSSQGATFPTAAEIVEAGGVREIAYALYNHGGQNANSAQVIGAVANAPETTDSETGEVLVERAHLVLYEEGELSEAEVAAHFSDEVNVVPDVDGRSGVIRPVFRAESEEEYRYLLVPIAPP